MKRTYTEADISRAIEAVFKGLSANQAAKDWGIPRRTLLNRLHGKQSHSIAHVDLQCLSQV